MPLPVSLLVLLHSLFPKLARPGGLNLMATYLQNTGRRSHSKGWADQPNVSHSLNVHLLPHRIHGTIVYWPTWTVDFLWSIRRYIYQSHESYGYLSATESETKKTIPKIFAWLQAALEVVWWGIWCSIEPACTTFLRELYAHTDHKCKRRAPKLPSYTNHESWCLQTIT